MQCVITSIVYRMQVLVTTLGEICFLMEKIKSIPGMSREKSNDVKQKWNIQEM